MNFKKNRIFFLTGGLLLIILATLFPLTFTYTYSMNEKYLLNYKDTKTFSEDISNYTMGVDGSLRLYSCYVDYDVINNYYKIVGYYYHYYLDLTPFSSEEINVTGILFYTYECLLDGISESNYSMTLDRASLIEEEGTIYVLNLNTIFTVRGSIQIEYTNNSTPFTEIIDFNLNIVHPDGSPEYNQALSLADSLFFWHIASFIIVPILFVLLPIVIQRRKKQPRMTSRDGEFWRKVRERNKLLREKNREA